MDHSLRSAVPRLAQRPEARLAVLLGGCVALGLVIATLPLPFLILSAFVATMTIFLVRFPAGVLCTAAFMILQTPIQNLVERSQDFGYLAPYVGYVDDVLIALLALAALWHARVRIQKNVLIAPSLVAALIALGFGLTAAWLHFSVSRAISLDAFSFSKWFLLLFAAFQIDLPLDRLLVFLRGATWAAVGLALFGYFDMLFPTITHETIPLAGGMAYRLGLRCLVSCFPHEGTSGWFFAAMACLPIAGYLVLRRPVDLAAAVFLAVSSFLSYRRKPIVGLAFALGMVMILQPNLKRTSRILIAVGLIALVVVPIMGPALRDIFHDTYGQYIAPPDPMLVARNALYIVSWQIACDYFPLGAGLGLFGGHASRIEYSEFYARYGLNRVWGLSASADSSPGNPNFTTDVFFPHVLGALGFVGGALYVLALLYPAARLTGFLRRAREPAARVLVTAALLVFFEALAESVAAPVYEVSLSCMVVYGLVGVALAAAASSGLARKPVGAGEMAGT